MKIAKTKQEVKKEEITDLYSKRWRGLVSDRCFTLSIVAGLILWSIYEFSYLFISIGVGFILVELIVQITPEKANPTALLEDKKSSLVALKEKKNSSLKDIPREENNYSSKNIDDLKEIYRLETQIQQLEVQIEILLSVLDQDEKNNLTSKTQKNEDIRS